VGGSGRHLDPRLRHRHHGEWNGARVVGVKLTFDKRYITLAPVATLIGLAFRMYDPDGLLGDKRDIGITLALLPRDTPGVEIGRRHFPLNSPFQNGPDPRPRSVHAAERS
jgi:acyl-CoA dehydrogenase